MLAAVVAGAPDQHRWRQQTARRVGPHVAHGHPDAGGELVDGQLRLLVGSRQLRLRPPWSPPPPRLGPHGKPLVLCISCRCHGDGCCIAPRPEGVPCTCSLLTHVLPEAPRSVRCSSPPPSVPALTALLLGLVYAAPARGGRRSSPGSARGWAGDRRARLGRAADGAHHGLPARRPVRDAVGHQPAHRRRPRPGPAGQPGPLLHPVRPVRRLLRRRASPARCRCARSPGPPRVRFLHGWDVPVGGLLVAGAGFYALLGFPLDDIWHRLFGQDVTLWGPTHLMLITGAGPVDHRPADPRAGGPRRAVQRRRRPQGRPHHPVPPAGLGHGRPAAGPVGVPGRVRLRRPAVPAGPGRF